MSKESNFEDALSSLMAEENKKTFVLSTAPMWRFTLVRASDESHHLVWSLHHITLDGWSSYIILRELLALYDSAIKGEPIDAAVDNSYSKYLAHQNRGLSSETKSFWQRYLAGFDAPTLVANNQGTDQQEGTESFEEQQLLIEGSEALKALARQERISLNALMKGLWSIVLGEYLDASDVLIGVTVSGRNDTNFDAENMVGMLMNVLPFRSTIDPTQSFADFLRSITLQDANRMAHEQADLNDILRHMDAIDAEFLFDTVFVFENFAQEPITGGGLAVKDFKSGVTSTYPLTVVVLPSETISVTLKYNRHQISKLAIEALVNAFQKTVEMVTTQDEVSIADLQKVVNQRTATEDDSEEAIQSIYKRSLIFSRNKTGTNISKLKRRSQGLDNYVAPTNTTELMLSHLWEDLFGFNPIGLDDDFFALGGTSMMAIRLFAQIEKNTGQNLPPTTLLQHRTIRALSSLLLSADTASWSTIVPLKAGGSQQPLFCLHAGGAHVFFYHDLARLVGGDRPAYAIQPVGLDGQADAHETIEEMAQHYIEEIKKVQPEGPYAVLGTCFSDAVAFEIAHQLFASGSSVDPLVIVDAQPTGRARRQASLKEKIKWNAELVVKGNFSMLFKRIKTRVINLFGEGDQWEMGQYDRFDGVDQVQLESLDGLRGKLASLYGSYQWKPYDKPVDYIHSEDFGGGTRIKINQEMWQEVVKGELRIHTVKGHHFTLFEQPDVHNLAEVVREIMRSRELAPT